MHQLQLQVEKEERENEELKSREEPYEEGKGVLESGKRERSEGVKRKE